MRGGRHAMRGGDGTHHESGAVCWLAGWLLCTQCFTTLKGSDGAGPGSPAATAAHLLLNDCIQHGVDLLGQVLDQQGQPVLDAVDDLQAGRQQQQRVMAAAHTNAQHTTYSNKASPKRCMAQLRCCSPCFHPSHRVDVLGGTLLQDAQPVGLLPLQHPLDALQKSGQGRGGRVVLDCCGRGQMWGVLLGCHRAAQGGTASNPTGNSSSSSWVRLQLGVDQERPAGGGCDDGAVLDGQRVGGQPLVGPLGLQNRSRSRGEAGGKGTQRQQSDQALHVAAVVQLPPCTKHKQQCRPARRRTGSRRACLC